MHNYWGVLKYRTNIYGVSVRKPPASTATHQATPLELRLMLSYSYILYSMYVLYVRTVRTLLYVRTLRTCGYCKYNRLLYFGNFTVISDHLKGAHSNTLLLKKLAVTTVIVVSN
jgi:hypothetical protein